MNKLDYSFTCLASCVAGCLLVWLTLCGGASATQVLNYWDMDTVDGLGIPQDVVGGVVTTAAVPTGANPPIMDATTYGSPYAGAGNGLISVVGPTGYLLADVFDDGNGIPLAMDFGAGSFSFSCWSFDDFGGDGDVRGPRIFDNLVGTTTGIQLGSNLQGIFNYRTDDDLGNSVLSNSAGNLDTLMQAADIWTHVAVNVSRADNTAEVFFNGGSQGTYDISVLTANVLPTQDMQIGVINGGTTAGAAQNSGLDDLAFYSGILSQQQITGLASAVITPLDIVERPLTLRINTTTGATEMVNEAGRGIEIDFYEITSASGSLDPASWNSLQDQDLAGFPAGDGTGNGWEEGDSSNAFALGEGYLLGSSLFADGTSINLGSLFNQATGTQDLAFSYNDVGSGVFTRGAVEYVQGGPNGDFNDDGQWNCVDIDALVAEIVAGTNNGAFDMNGDGQLTAADITDDGAGWLAVGGANNSDDTGGNPFLAGDADLNGDVDVSDFNSWNTNKFTQTAAWCSADFNADGSTDVSDFNIWNGSKFNSAGGVSVVPEPTAWVLLGLGMLFIGGRRGRGARRLATRFGPTACGLLILLCAVVGARSALAEVSDDRFYRFGDDPLEGAVEHSILGSGNGFGTTLDSEGPTGAYLDLLIRGNPIYVSVSDRPGASAGDLGAELDGLGDALTTNLSLNAPAEFWDNTDVFVPGVNDYPFHYGGIFSHGMQLWAKPHSAAQDQRQDLAFDTVQHGVFITDQNTWALAYDGAEIDSGQAVAYDQWSHVMQLAGFNDPVAGRSRTFGALLVNGVAVSVRGTTYNADTTPLSVGSDQEITDHFYQGVLDDMRVFLWGDNSAVAPGPASQTGRRYGTLNLGEDNEWIAHQLASLDATDVGDVNLDGIVTGDGAGLADVDDVTRFIEGWTSVRIVDGVQIGDWISRQNGDLNYDGVVDLDDAFLLHDGLVAAGGPGLDFSLLHNVPEPSVIALSLLAAAIGVGASRRRGP